MDIEKLVERGAQIFCCDASCASTYDGRPCSAGAHQVRTRAVIALTLKAAAEEARKDVDHWMREAGYRRLQSGEWIGVVAREVEDHNRAVHYSNAALALEGRLRAIAAQFAVQL